jgi:uncharacterized protein (DUF2147 family)
MRLIVAPLLASALFALPAAAHAAEPITGQWFTKDARAIVTIAPCGSKVCGRITQALKRKPGETGLDAKNPNPALRSRKIVGLQILSDFVDSGSDWRGQIYSPEAGKDYRSILKKLPDGSLQVQGCISFICQTQNWKPAR